MVKNSSFNPDESYKYRWTNVWIGPGGATTHTHYDISQNFYAQIYGVKRFVLFPPEAHEYLYLYPFLHPGAQQSQINFDAPDLKSFPKFKNARAIEAILNPGDVLYLPPLWFHHVTALSTSISVSVWTNFPETSKMHQIARSPLPLKKKWENNKFILSGQLFLQLLIEELDGKGSAESFVKNLIDLRYGHLSKKSLKPRNDISFCKEALLPFTQEDILKDSQEEFDLAIKNLKILFQSSENKARRDIWLGNYVEQLAMMVVGVENVVNFLIDFVNC